MNVLSTQEIDNKLKELPDWQTKDNSIQRSYTLKNFDQALDFVNKVGEAAQKADHHPDIFLHGWNKVDITLSTHSAGGVTENDINMAQQIEKLSQ